MHTPSGHVTIYLGRLSLAILNLSLERISVQSWSVKWNNFSEYF